MLKVPFHHNTYIEFQILNFKPVLNEETIMFTLFMVLATLVWAAMFVLPLAGYVALSLSLLKSEKANNSTKNRHHNSSVQMKVSHA
jgi:hypothetical protein